MTNHLRQIRKERQLTILRLARLARVGQGTICEIENNNDLPPSEDTRQRLADALNVKQSDIWPELAAVAS